MAWLWSSNDGTGLFASAKETLHGSCHTIVATKLQTISFICNFFTKKKKYRAKKALKKFAKKNLFCNFATNWQKKNTRP